MPTIQVTWKSIGTAISVLSVVVSIWVTFVLLQKRMEYLENQVAWLSARIWAEEGHEGPPPPGPHW